MRMGDALWYALIGTGFTFLATAAGSAMVYFIPSQRGSGSQRVFLGFAAGVMIAASVWSLLIPSIDMAQSLNFIEWLPAAGGFVLGALFLMLLDKLLPHMHAETGEKEGVSSSLRRTTLLVLAVTLHNIPEGLAVGISFGIAAMSGDPLAFAASTALAIGMALQNFPEGAAISLPLKDEGLSKTKAFIYGALSGIVEPIAGVLGVLIAVGIMGIMPWMLSFAAGAMMYVVVEELIPVAVMTPKRSRTGTISVLIGFLIMMVLDIALG